MAFPKVEWNYSENNEHVHMTFESPEEFYSERRRLIVEMSKKSESPAVITPKVVVGVRV